MSAVCHKTNNVVIYSGSYMELETGNSKTPGASQFMNRHRWSTRHGLQC